jgi:tRNA A-37 threonylcarbamoyl transferase component Bud32
MSRVIKFADKFILEREIGSGGMSRVFLGRDEILDRLVAIKVLKSELGETDVGARFRREGRTAAKLSHPNIVQVYDAGEGEFEGRETSYIVMEYVSGGDLKELIDRRRTLSSGDLAKLSDVAAGLVHAHERGVIHRDIKPHNILLDEHGRPKLTDFGIARALDTTTATRTGSYLGTALYSSPEQLQGQTVTPKSDVYSLGVTLYHAATGRPPFVGSSIEVANQHVSIEPTPPRELNDAVSPSLETLILDCLKKDPDSRPTADEVRLGLLEAGRGVHATRAYVAPPVTAPTKTEQPRPAPASSTREAPPPGAAVGRSGGATTYGHRRWARGALVVLALVAVLAVIGALALPTLRGGEGERGGVAQNNGGGNPSGGDQAKGGGNPQGASGQRSESASASASATESAASEPQGQGGLTKEAAEQTVQDFYESAVRGDTGRAYELLTAEWRQQYFPTQADLEGTFEPVRDVTFVEGPTAEVSGDTATVTGITRAELTTQTERNKGSWTLVNENGEWRINEWTVTRLSTQPA